MNAWRTTFIGFLTLSAVGCSGATSIGSDSSDATSASTVPATVPAAADSAAGDFETASIEQSVTQAPSTKKPSRIHALADHLGAPSVSCSPVASDSTFVDTSTNWAAATDFAVDVRRSTETTSAPSVEAAQIAVETSSDSITTLLWSGSASTNASELVGPFDYQVTPTEGFVGLVDPGQVHADGMAMSLQRDLTLLHRFDDRFIFDDGQQFNDVAINPTDGAPIGVEATLDIGDFQDRDGCIVLRYRADGHSIIAPDVNADADADTELPYGMFGIQSGAGQAQTLSYSTVVEAQFDPTSGRIVRIVADETMSSPDGDDQNTTMLLTIVA